MTYKAYTLRNFRNMPQIDKIPEECVEAIDIVGRVLPFKANSYVVEQLIDWNNIPNDPIFTLTFPRRDMISEEVYTTLKQMVDSGAPQQQIDDYVLQVRMQLNPNPAGQKSNIPTLGESKLEGLQHKYEQTVLFFPTQGQTCHAYCSFCFRWPQFSGMADQKFQMREVELLYAYLEEHKEVTDLLITGGDPMVMSSKILASYIEPVLNEERFSHIRTIRIGTKSLSYWPYRFTTDPDSKDILDLFSRVVKSGRSLAIQAHFNHYAELSTRTVKDAVKRILGTGAQIRTQSPLLKHINDDSTVWARMWREQVDMGMIPYYMFIARDTGSKAFFEVPLERCWQIFKGAYSSVSGVCRTVRGPSMSATQGKIQVLGVTEIRGEKVFALRFLQGRSSDWVAQPFFAEYDPEATWFDQLKPAFGEDKFFFE